MQATQRTFRRHTSYFSHDVSQTFIGGIFCSIRSLYCNLCENVLCLSRPTASSLLKILREGFVFVQSIVFDVLFVTEILFSGAACFHLFYSGFCSAQSGLHSCFVFQRRVPFGSVSFYATKAFTSFGSVNIVFAVRNMVV